MKRRSFLEAGVGALMMDVPAAAAAIPIIDTHIHLFDTARPQGVPWPAKDNAALYMPALPGRYRKIAGPLGVVGAIEVECSTWLEDNQWVLDTAAAETIITGTVGNLEPGKPEFAKHLERFHRNPLFLGIRYGNLWDRDLGAGLRKPEFVADLKLLAQAGLTLDTANPTPQLMEDALRLTDAVPELRVVLDHLPAMQPTGTLRQLSQRPHVFAKISGVVRRVEGRVPVDTDFYRDRLDALYGAFGQDRVLFGSDWPNSDQWARFPEVLNLVSEYFQSKGPQVAAKYFWRNSKAAYRWVPREPGQFQLQP